MRLKFRKDPAHDIIWIQICSKAGSHSPLEREETSWLNCPEINSENEEVWGEVKRWTETGNRSELAVCATLRTPTGPFQIYQPLMDHEAINPDESFRVITAPEENSAAPRQLEAADVLAASDKYSKVKGVWFEIRQRYFIILPAPELWERSSSGTQKSANVCRTVGQNHRSSHFFFIARSPKTSSRGQERLISSIQ